jgi:hypothetical protein
MQAISALLFLATTGLVAASVIKIRHDDFLAGTHLIAWAFVPLTVLLGFTWRTTCKVKTTSSKPCGNDAYGFLFGCNRTAGHWLGKFRVRLGMQRDEVKQAKRRQATGNYAVMYQVAPEPQPMKVTVEDNGLGICGFWVSVVSAVTGIIQVVIAFTIH